MNSLQFANALACWPLPSWVAVDKIMLSALTDAANSHPHTGQGQRASVDF